jgi:hypothetical protein
MPISQSKRSASSIVGRCDDHAHSHPAPAQPVDEIPELPARQGIDAGGGLVQDQQIGIVNERAAESELLPHAARQVPGRPVGEGRKSRALQELPNPPFALLAGLAEQPGKELDILLHAQVGIEILAKPLRHVGDPRTYRRAGGGIGNVGTENEDLALLDLPRAREDREQRGLAHAVGSDQSDELPRWQGGGYVIERGCGAVEVTKSPDDDDRLIITRHGEPSRFFGQASFASQRT